jgi:hypothetical protein
METHIAQDLICPQMIRGDEVYFALWTSHKLYIALGCMKFISLTFKSPFLTAHTTYSSTKFKHMVLKGQRIVAFCENHKVKTNFVREMESFFILKKVVVKAFL